MRLAEQEDTLAALDAQQPPLTEKLKQLREAKLAIEMWRYVCNDIYIYILFVYIYSTAC